MKVFSVIAKILTALAAIAGAIYIIATYGDKIVAWAKEIWAKYSGVTVEVEANVECAEPATEEPVAAEEVAEEPAAEVVEEEAFVEEVPEVQEEAAPAENAPVADESDFEG